VVDDAERDAPELDPPDAESVYRNYVETCRRLGVEPVPRDRAQDLMAEWSDAGENASARFAARTGTEENRRAHRDRCVDADRVLVGRNRGAMYTSSPSTHGHAQCPIQVKSHAFS
jgi:hypothetical protein